MNLSLEKLFECFALIVSREGVPEYEDFKKSEAPFLLQELAELNESAVEAIYKESYEEIVAAIKKPKAEPKKKGKKAPKKEAAKTPDEVPDDSGAETEE